MRKRLKRNRRITIFINRIIFQAPSLEESVDYHFVAFVEKDGTLYDLDGRKPGPLNCGKTTKETFLKVTFIS